MKKSLLLFVMLLFVCSGMRAQIVSSRSVGMASQPERPSEIMWYLRAGLNMSGFVGDDVDGLDRKTAYSLTYGFQKPIGSLGAYWGMDFGLGSRGYKLDELSLLAHNIQVSPFTFGWKYEVVDNLSIDGHVGAFLGCDYMGKIKYDGESLSMGDWEDELGLEWNRFDAGMNIGFGLWYDRFNLDFTFQRGFVGVMSDTKAYTSNLMLRLGVAF